MTTKTRNEAAERLLRRMDDYLPEEVWSPILRPLLDEAVAAERRATVERLRAGSQALMYRAGKNEVIAVDALALILDEEAAR